MLVDQKISFARLIRWTWEHTAQLLLLSAVVAALYAFNLVPIALPWLPISVMGTAVAFYLGFKNNSAYDRMWEARKIWGGIVNDSRSWGMMVDGYVSNLFRQSDVDQEEIQSIKRRLIYRHIAWLYAHRSQLLVAAPWEYMSQGGRVARKAEMFQKTYGIGLVDDEVTRTELKVFLPEHEHDRLVGHVNTAAQIINEQSRDLRSLREQDLIDDFRHMEMVNLLRSFYALQGKNERIKKFPLPRQYASMSRLFVWTFVLLLPFTMIPELMKLGSWGFWLSIPVNALVGWIYVTMEAVGDYSENPFQGMANDIPMLSLCRTVEIDLREMLGETELPQAVAAKNGILM